jgi:membrane-bound lytic murein transglycosylase D
MKQIFIHKIILKKIFSFVLILIFSLGILYSQESDNSEKSATETQIVQQENDTSEIVDEKTILPIVEKKLILNKDYSKNSLVQKQIEQYTSNFAKDWLNSVMSESLKYRAYVQKILKENNLPQELQYLPVIESSYKISALSKSGAYGMWQFMKNSISPFNIRINSWMDERKDPWLSTNAAVKKLKENYDYLGSWELALAAYNCGLGAINRTIKKAGNSDFWYLAEKGFLKTETKNLIFKYFF